MLSSYIFYNLKNLVFVTFIHFLHWMPKLERRFRLKTDAYNLQMHGRKEESAPAGCITYYTAQGKRRHLVNTWIFEIFSLLLDTKLKFLVNFNNIFFV